MIDLIERKKVLSIIHNDLHKKDFSKETSEYLFNELRHKIWAIPSYNNEYGIWLDARTNFKCSHCGFELDGEFPWFEMDLPDYMPTYCPKCGVRMFCEDIDIKDILKIMFGVKDEIY